MTEARPVSRTGSGNITASTRTCISCGALLTESGTASESLCGNCRVGQTLADGSVANVGDGQPREQLAAEANPAPDPIGETVGAYELLEEIARGGMGVVWRARHQKLRREVALKMILGGRFSSPEAVQRFRMEAEAAAKLDHPGIVPVYDIGEHGGQPFFTMKLIDGRSLSAIKAEFRGRQPAAAELVAKIAEAVHHAHRRGILHRDIKPANILIDADGNPMLTDLGLARDIRSESGLTQTNAVLGTPGYMAPEQARPGIPVTTAADIYALGAILYDLLTGRPPHVGDSAVSVVMSLLNESVTPPVGLDESIRPELSLICMKCLASDPDERYASAAEVAEDLRHFVAGRPISISLPSRAARVKAWLNRNRSVGYVALAVIAACLLAAPLTLSMLGSLDNPASRYIGTAEDPRPLLYSLSNVPPWVSVFAAVALVTLWPMLGGFVTLIAEPKRWFGAAGRGALTGLLCSAVFLLLFGWVPFSLSVTASGDSSIRVLARIAYPDGQSNADTLREQLEARYPMLGDLRPDDRDDYLANRIAADSLSWGPVLVGIILLVVLFLTTTQAMGSWIMYLLSSRGHRWWILWPRYALTWFFGFLTLIIWIAAALGGRFQGRPFTEHRLLARAAFLLIPPLLTGVLLLRRRQRSGSD